MPLLTTGAGAYVAAGGGGTALPLTGNLVFKLSADSITGLSNGASLTTSSWVDSQNSIAADGIIGTGPTFQTNQINGKPSVRFGGSGGLSLSTPGALRTAIDSQVYTVLIVAKTIHGIGFFDHIFGATAGGNSFFFYSDGTNVGRFDGGKNINAISSGASFFTTGCISGVDQSIPHELRMFNGTSFYSGLSSASPGSGGNTFCLGTDAGQNFKWNGDLFDIFVWNTNLTPAQYMQAQMAVCDKYAQPYPWAGISKMPVYFADSISAGILSTVITTLPSYLSAQTTLGLTYGQYQDLSIPGLSMDGMTALAPTYVNPIAAQIGKKIGAICWEWANQRDTTTTKGALLLAALKATPNVQTVFGTSTSAAQYDNSTDRATYNSNWNAIGTGAMTNMDSYMPIHTDTHIGVDGSYATFSSTTGGDGLHLTDTTNPYLAALLSTGFSALP